MDSDDALRALRKYLKAERISHAESLLTTPNVERARGRVLQLDDALKKLTELLHSTEGESDDSSK